MIQQDIVRWLIVGNPNVGKSTLFSMMTGCHAVIGNRPGVTVMSQEASFSLEKNALLVDLPGIYLIESDTDACSIDQQVTLSYLNHPLAGDVLVNVCDARSLRRQLYLTLQLAEIQRPMVMILTHPQDKDEHLELERALHIPVLSVNSTIDPWTFKKLLSRATLPSLPHLIGLLLKEHFDALENLPINERSLEKSDLTLSDNLDTRFWGELANRTQIQDKETSIATARYDWIDHLLKSMQKVTTSPHRADETLNYWTLHRWLGLPFFVLVMYITFWVTIVGGDYFSPILENTVKVLFAVLRFYSANQLGALVDSLELGCVTLAEFFTPLFMLYFMLGLWEETGYMQRASLVIDRLMQQLNLPGQSFVPMIVGFGCNVPSIMSSRTLNYERDRIQTILMSPFMSCSARLAIFSVFATAFFGDKGHNIIFGLYFFGFVVAIFTGMAVRVILQSQGGSPLIQELVPYHRPNFKNIFILAWKKAKSFLLKASTMIVPVTFVIHLLVQSSFEMSPKTQAILVAPLKPIGLTQKEWPAAVSLFSGLIAKEVVIGTLQAFQELPPHQDETFNHNNTTSLSQYVYEHVFSEEAKNHEVVLNTLFHNQHAALSYMIFVLLYFPCVSVTAAISKELTHFWAFFSVIWTTSLAYICSMLYYQWAMGLDTLSYLGILAASLMYLAGLLIFARYKARCMHRRKIPVRILQPSSAAI